jgi:hypothetical protein
MINFGLGIGDRGLGIGGISVKSSVQESAGGFTEDVPIRGKVLSRYDESPRHLPLYPLS